MRYVVSRISNSKVIVVNGKPPGVDRDAYAEANPGIRFTYTFPRVTVGRDARIAIVVSITKPSISYNGLDPAAPYEHDSSLTLAEHEHAHIAEARRLASQENIASVLMDALTESGERANIPLEVEISRSANVREVSAWVRQVATRVETFLKDLANQNQILRVDYKAIENGDSFYTSQIKDVRINIPAPPQGVTVKVGSAQLVDLPQRRPTTRDEQNGADIQ